ncbi:hypothetical protein M404DRAFT_991957 [Pisolithus tinctorius Marx 270]|uniref:Uncharacterized protein n=1 Tax=Pisolithus tinctorius Marx 270 TaxID=870435 RepID=A0A0C3K1E3_PISTI|nr:hypothetical protein M404DRAFT_991957 [Pisolithus tinctorius Marx 270]
MEFLKGVRVPGVFLDYAVFVQEMPVTITPSALHIARKPSHQTQRMREAPYDRVVSFKVPLHRRFTGPFVLSAIQPHLAPS